MQESVFYEGLGQVKLARAVRSWDGEGNGFGYHSVVEHLVCMGPWVPCRALKKKQVPLV
jgi:hypothetical protein